MKYALIGCGRVSGSHIKAAIHNNLEITALCDIVPEKAQLLKEKYNLDAEIFSDYKEMLQKIKPEITAIATISGTHGEIALYCAENGYNFMVEKPMAMSIAEADRVITAAEKSGVTAGVCHQNRFNIAVQELRHAIDDNRFGKLSHGSVHIRWCRDADYYNQDDWRGKWASDGGALMNQCIHGIDLLRWMMGDEVESVYGSVRNHQHPYIEAEDIGVAVVNFKNGAVATIEGTVNTVESLEETLCVFGENGMVRLGGMNASTVDVWKFKDEVSDDEYKRDIEEKAPNVYGNGHKSLYYNIIEALKNKTQPYVDLYAGKRALEIVLAIYKSQLTGEKVYLPLEDFASSDMKDTFIKK